MVGRGECAGRSREQQSVAHPFVVASWKLPLIKPLDITLLFALVRYPLIEEDKDVAALVAEKSGCSDTRLLGTAVLDICCPTMLIALIDVNWLMFGIDPMPISWGGCAEGTLCISAGGFHMDMLVLRW